MKTIADRFEAFSLLCINATDANVVMAMRMSFYAGVNSTVEALFDADEEALNEGGSFAAKVSAIADELERFDAEIDELKRNAG